MSKDNQLMVLSCEYASQRLGPIDVIKRTMEREMSIAGSKTRIYIKFDVKEWMVEWF